MDPAVQAKVDELVAAALTAGSEPAEVLPALNAAYKNALIASEAARTIPVPNMPAGDLLALLAFLNDGNGVEDVQAVYRLLRNAIADRNQPAFWRYLFILVKAFRKQNPYLE